MFSNPFGGKVHTENFTAPRDGWTKTTADAMAENERRVAAASYESNDEIQKASATMRGKSYHLVLSELILKIERLEMRIAELESNR